MKTNRRIICSLLSALVLASAGLSTLALAGDIDSLSKQANLNFFSVALSTS